jgi:bla regulator protein BlaR1
MNTLLTFVPEKFVNALGWTIFHSLWQGMIIGIILFLIFKFRRNLSSQARYLLGVFTLAAIFTLSLFTFLIAYHPVFSQADFVSYSSASISNLAGIYERADELSVLNPVSSGWQQSLIRTFDFVSIVWFIGVLLLAVRLAGGMLVINGMRRQEISPLPAGWEQRLQMLAVKTGISGSITYLQSQKVRVPVVIGMLRPVVLIPAMIISGLPADQLESIIVHELAHIRRHDFLINILQSIMEALFFYHPVVWIISENVRQEREKCCDDYTVRVCGKVSIYARALACLSELQITATIPSIAITGNKKNIVHRVERLINNQKMKTNTTERLIAGLVLTTSVLIITLSTGATFKPSGFAQMESQIEMPLMDKIAAVPVNDPEPVAEPAAIADPAAIPEPASIILPSPAVPGDTTGRHERDKMDIKDNTITREFHNKEGEDQEMKFVVKQGKVKELYVDGQKIPDDEFSKYQKEIDVTMKDLQDMEQDLKLARVELDNVDFDKIREQIQIDLEHFKDLEMKDLQEEMQKLQEDQIKMQMDEKALQAEIEQAMKDVQIDQEKMLKDMELGMAELQEGMAMLGAEDIQKMMDEALKSVQEIEEAMKEIKEIDFAEIEKDIQAALQNLDEEKFNMEKEKKNIDEMIEELEKLELDEK